MIVTSNLAKGALNLSKHQVIVKELPAMQNLGAMDILCTDKTGTITEDRVVLVEHLNPLGEVDEKVLDMAYLNSQYQTGWKNLMDVAVIEYYEKQKRQSPFKEIIKIDELPFVRGSKSRWTSTDDHQRRGRRNGGGLPICGNQRRSSAIDSRTTRKNARSKSTLK